MRLLPLVFTLLALTGPAQARPKVYPYVVSDRPGENACVDGDPYGPCRGRIIKVKNPSWKRRYYVRVGCRDIPHLQTVAVLRPRHTVEFNLLWGGPGSLVPRQCRIENIVSLSGRTMVIRVRPVKRASR